ncbi:hypothetical protein LK542_03090 [Massilia sp. IC2-477]|uniref:hypothetical protein n=1 Tax=Massilia sp. IC2-477 TaxID=2887198 RepID=UPI001D128DA4|nr:hypothetical protein [Massilia sp. IC2-477]MCC2954598.1 hypothetical protein [Massilia sp. IC2-477]
MRPTKSMIALLLALGSSCALAQNGASPQPPTGKPVSDSASYGPVLNPQTPPATTQQPTQAAGEARPQAQEERAGQPPVTSKQVEVDPSARPAPGSNPPQGQAQPQTRQQNQQPMTEQEKRGQPERQQQTKKQAQRRPGAVQQITSTPRIVAPAPTLTPRAPAPGVSAPVGPQTSQVIGCAGSGCTDVNGGSYNASGPGNTTVSSSGRLCTRNGANMQCI